MGEDRVWHDKRRGNGTLLDLDELNHKRFGVDILVGDGKGPGLFFTLHPGVSASAKRMSCDRTI